MITGKQAANRMKRWSELGRTNVKGLCLKTVREAWLFPAKYPSAIIAWRNTPKQHKFTDWRNAPVGALHFYEGGKYGHVVIQSDKKNMVWGTDLTVTNKIGFHSRRLPVRLWKYKYLGWTNWLNGRELKVLTYPK